MILLNNYMIQHGAVNVSRSNGFSAQLRTN